MELERENWRRRTLLLEESRAVEVVEVSGVCFRRTISIGFCLGGR